MLVVYTALFGDYDTLCDPVEAFEECKFICFTDQTHLKSDIWEIRIVKNANLPPNQMNRKYKLLPHLYLGDFDQSLYIDSNIRLLSNPNSLLTKYADSDFAVPYHFQRDCIYDEALECINLKKANYCEIIRQMRFYKNEGMPEKFGLGENNILLRRHNNPKIIKLMEDWWCQISTHTKRDQLSLAYVLWKAGTNYTFMEETSRQSVGIFEISRHKHQISRSLFSKIVNKVISTSRGIYFSKICHPKW